MTDLEDLFAIQKKYNDEIIESSIDKSSEGWTQTYLLGIVSEMDEVLREINWKKHRKTGVITDPTNLGLELADLTKYIISMWIVNGYTANDMIDHFMMKSKMLIEKRRQEYEKIPEDRLVVISDLDGTICDWRKTFVEWMKNKGVEINTSDNSSSLLIDYDLLIKYPKYYELKEEFESSGQYFTIMPYEDGIILLQILKQKYNSYIIIHTARPIEKYKRIWIDTWDWTLACNLQIDQLLMGSESRILMAEKLAKTRKVLILEDDPNLILRAAMSGLKVLARKHKYNENIIHPNVILVENFGEVNLEQLIQSI